jgi:hypothetical protein
MAGDTTYNQMLSDLTRDHGNAEQAAAEQQQAAAQQEAAASTAESAMNDTNTTVDAASGLGLDSASMSALMDHAEAQKTAKEKHDAALEAVQAAEAANLAVMETAQTAQDTLSRNHSQYQEATDNSPVESADAAMYAA